MSPVIVCASNHLQSVKFVERILRNLDPARQPSIIKVSYYNLCFATWRSRVRKSFQHFLSVRQLLGPRLMISGVLCRNVSSPLDYSRFECELKGVISERIRELEMATKGRKGSYRWGVCPPFSTYILKDVNTRNNYNVTFHLRYMSSNFENIYHCRGNPSTVK